MHWLSIPVTDLHCFEQTSASYWAQCHNTENWNWFFYFCCLYLGIHTRHLQFQKVAILVLDIQLYVAGLLLSLQNHNNLKKIHCCSNSFFFFFPFPTCAFKVIYSHGQSRSSLLNVSMWKRTDRLGSTSRTGISNSDYTTHFQDPKQAKQFAVRKRNL